MTRRLLVLGVLLVAGCATVRESHVRPDYEQTDRTQTVRLVVVVAPLPDGREDLGALWGHIARRYANLHRDFIVSDDTASAALPDGPCAEGVEGVLHLAREAAAAAGEVAVGVLGHLFRCRDRETVWRAEAGGSWPSVDEQLVELTARYVEELGEGVRAHVAPTFRLLRETLDTLPKPHLATDEAVMEKIQLEE